MQTIFVRKIATISYPSILIQRSKEASYCDNMKERSKEFNLIKIDVRTLERSISLG